METGQRWARFGLIALLIIASAACTSSGDGPARRSDPAPASVQPSPPATTTGTPATTTGTPATTTGTPARHPRACGRGARAFWLPGPDGTWLEANAYGAGTAAAVFLHQAGAFADMCGFWPYARWLARQRHVLVVLFNRCTYGRSTCDVFQQGDAGIVTQVQPAVEWARRHGARRVTLVGASSGGSDALQAAGVVRHVDAVVDISGDSADTGVDDPPNARRLRVPALFAVAPGDPIAPVPTVRRLFALDPARPKRLIVVRRMPATHGWDLLQDPQTMRFTALADVVADWVAGG